MAGQLVKSLGLLDLARNALPAAAVRLVPTPANASAAAIRAIGLQSHDGKPWLNLTGPSPALEAAAAQHQAHTITLLGGCLLSPELSAAAFGPRRYSLAPPRHPHELLPAIAASQWAAPGGALGTKSSSGEQGSNVESQCLQQAYNVPANEACRVSSCVLVVYLIIKHNDWDRKM